MALTVGINQIMLGHIKASHDEINVNILSVLQFFSALRSKSKSCYGVCPVHLFLRACEDTIK